MLRTQGVSDATALIAVAAQQHHRARLWVSDVHAQDDNAWTDIRQPSLMGRRQYTLAPHTLVYPALSGLSSASSPPATNSCFPEFLIQIHTLLGTDPNGANLTAYGYRIAKVERHSSYASMWVCEYVWKATKRPVVAKHTHTPKHSHTHTLTHMAR